jgi:hypothetical protein
MRQPANAQQRDHRAVMGQRIETTGRHHRHPVQQFRADAGGVGQFQIFRSQGAEGDAHAAGGGAGDAGQDVNRDRFRNQRIGRDAQHRVFHHQERRQRGDDVAIADLGGGVEDRQQRTHGAGIERFDHVASNALPVHDRR